MEPFRIALQEHLWSDNEVDPLPTLITSTIGDDNRTIFLVVKTSHTTLVTFSLPVPLDYPGPQRQQIFGLAAGDEGASGPTFSDGLPQGRPWAEAIEAEQDEHLKAFWLDSLQRIRLMFPTPEDYLTNFTDYLSHSIKSEPSLHPATLINIYTQRTNKRRIAILINEGAVHRIDYFMPVPAQYPPRLFPGKEKGAVLGAEPPTHITVDWATEQGALASTGFIPWEEEIERLESVPDDGSAKYRLTQKLLTYWEDMVYNIYVALKLADISPASRIKYVRSGSDPTQVTRSQRVKKGARSETLRRPKRRARISQRSERKTRRRSNLHFHVRDPNDPAAVSSEIGRVVPQRRSNRVYSSRVYQPPSEHRPKSEPKGPIL
jgi:hypothetical protein